MSLGSARFFAFAVFAVTSLTGEALASTITQNTSWTIQRAGSTSTWRVVAYGDSIFAGYNGGLFSVDKRAAPLVDGEYLAAAWNSNVEVVRRTKSGAIASDIYNNKIVAERGYMQATNTRVVTFEMCGNDYLQARSSFAGQTGTCNYAVIDTALANCTNYTGLAMQAINSYASTARAKIVMNLYYPGYNADNHLSSCNDPATGQPVNLQQKFFPYLARSNYRTCSLAATYGFACADAFAEWMGADYDSNGDGVVDSVALRFDPAETEEQYVQRVTTTLRATVRDANGHLANASTSYDYLLSDDTHPTYYGGTISLNIFTGTGSGSGAPDFSDAQIVGGKNPVWNTLGHERAGWTVSTKNPAAP